MPELDTNFLRNEIEFFRSQGIRVAMDDFWHRKCIHATDTGITAGMRSRSTGLCAILQNHPMNQIIVSAIADGARTIHATVCIEGIEDQALELYLQQYHPTYYQGYYLQAGG